MSGRAPSRRGAGGRGGLFVPALALALCAGPACSAADSGKEPAAEPAAVVEMTNELQFTPQTLRIEVGEAVEWRNTSVLVHTVTADPERAARGEHVALPEDAEPFHSGNLDPDATWQRRFHVPGRYRYFCIPHEAAGMTGTIVVEE